jgi:hypothetical protein
MTLAGDRARKASGRAMSSYFPTGAALSLRLPGRRAPDGDPFLEDMVPVAPTSVREPVLMAVRVRGSQGYAT